MTTWQLFVDDELWRDSAGNPVMYTSLADLHDEVTKVFATMPTRLALGVAVCDEVIRWLGAVLVHEREEPGCKVSTLMTPRFHVEIRRED